MTTNEKIRAIIWDLGGVLLRTEDHSYREKWEKRFGLEPWGLANLVFGSEMSQLASVGQARVDDIWDDIRDELDLDAQEIEQLRKDFFAGDYVDDELIAFIRKLKGSYKTGMITNAWQDIRHWIVKEWQIADAFDHILISAEVGMMKPNAEIYTLSLQMLDVLPKQAIFIDDFFENVEGAKAVGMKAIHFKSREDVISELKGILTI